MRIVSTSRRFFFYSPIKRTYYRCNHSEKKYETELLGRFKKQNVSK